MKQTDILLAKNRRQNKQLLVENKLTFVGAESELSIYDTYRSASRVGLNASQLMYCGMVQGKKIMHSSDLDGSHTKEGEVFLPHESFVLPSGGYVEIDFPEANEYAPTTCLTLEISRERIEEMSEKMRNLTQLEGLEYDWEYKPDILHTHHTHDTQQLLEKLVVLFTQDHPDKQMMMDLNISELIIRLLREQGRHVLLRYCEHSPDASGITAVINWIETHLALPLDIEQICRIACMSRSRLYTEFKKQLRCSPGEFQQQLRLKRAAKAIESGQSITSVCYDVGFKDLSHFSRRFTHFFGESPSHFKLKYNKLGQSK